MTRKRKAYIRTTVAAKAVVGRNESGSLCYYAFSPLAPSFTKDSGTEMRWKRLNSTLFVLVFLCCCSRAELIGS
jgi:hypothetical protein